MNFIKRLFCKHKFNFVRNLYGDEIHEYGGKRSIWGCSKCSKLQSRDDMRDTLIAEKCGKCDGEMWKGLAMESTVRGVPDFPGCDVVTMSFGGPGKLVDCLKCKNCGWSMTI